MLSNTTGAVLDPAFSLRSRLTLEPGQRAQLVFVTGVAETRDDVVSLVEKYRDMHATQRAFELTRLQAELEPRQLRISNDDIQRFQQLASHMLFPNARLRAAEQRLRQNRLGQSSLWAHGISGDLPMLVVTISARRDLELVREVLAAHTYWRLRGYVTDLVILNEEVGSYTQPLGDELKTLIQWHAQYAPIDQPGGIFLRSVDHIPGDDLTLLLAVARVMLVAARGPLAQQLAAPADTPLPPPLAVPRQLEEEVSAPLPFMELPYFNGLGGFTPDGKEYAIYLGPGSQTPAPWVNVFANPQFGTMVSEVGAGFSWHRNSQSNRLLPWSNDPISDPSGDAIYIRDEETGQFWSPTPAPIRELDAYRTRHGQGYSVFEHNSHAIEQELVTFVPMDDAGGATLRIQRLELRNRSASRRRLSVTTYAEWVLGTHRESTQMHVVTNWDSESQALFARNAYHADVGNHIAFASVSPRAASYTADRTEFLGRNGSSDRPAAMLRRSLSGRTGAGLDPCAALQVMVELDPGQDATVIMLVGQAGDATQARDMLQRFSAADRVDAALETTQAWWDNLLETIQVDTPDMAINFMLNRWLLYQTLSCRIWGRSGFYQSGGAVGFRDQLQDAMALLYAAPELSRQQILTAAARQFVEGDVQHWWHPQSGAGVRTRISDDLLWLPYVTTQYVRVTGDVEILDEIVPFLEGPPLAEHEHERYFMPATSSDQASLAEHCQRSIAKGLTRGSRGLPLIGTGDWNDGMNLVGVDGRGESVWLAWFLIDVLKGYAALVERRGQGEAASRYRAEAERLATAVEAEAWDGAWYRRAYFDDGTPLGSKTNDEATIDSLAQSWGVISGAADSKRADLALQSVESSLVREQDGMILLFTPPFEHTALDPGYIKGYPPGVRENGGQYTHAAIWVALAFARLKHGDRATSLLRMLNPVEHTRTPKDVQRYKVEPYVVAADIYALEGHVGQGGWTWYTGSSGWMYRVWIEDVLGFKLSADRITLDPVLQRDWQRVGIRYRYKRTHYDITIENPDGISSGVLWVELDHQRVTGQSIALQDDGMTHAVVVRLGHRDRW
jgi:cyclic beta-1,2-glucan synthetase